MDETATTTTTLQFDPVAMRIRVPLTDQRRRQLETMTRIGVAMSKYPGIRFRFSGQLTTDEHFALGEFEDVCVYPVYPSDVDPDAASRDIFASPLSTTQLLAISVLTDDDARAAAALADYLQEQGIDAIAAAKRQEREHIATVFDDLAEWHSEFGSAQLQRDYDSAAHLIRQDNFDHIVAVNEADRLSALDRSSEASNGI